MNFQKETDFAAKIASQQYLRPVADLGGGGDFFRDSTPCRPKGSPFCTILRYQYHFKADWPLRLIFLKAPQSPIYTNWGRARAENTQLFGRNFPKSA